MPSSNNENSDNKSRDVEAANPVDTTVSLKDNTSVLSTSNTSASNSNSNSRKPRESVLVRIDSELLQMASSIKDEFDKSAVVSDEDQRKAELCCLICCDLVTACIAVDICDIVLSILLVIASILSTTNDGFFNINLNLFTGSKDNYAVIDDDELLELRENQAETATYVTVLVGCGILFSIIGIVGAYRFQKYMVLTTGFWFCVDVVRSVVTFQWLNAVVAACFAYPHFALFHALRKGQITRDNYEVTEKHCCCECCER